MKELKIRKIKIKNFFQQNNKKIKFSNKINKSDKLQNKQK